MKPRTCHKCQKPIPIWNGFKFDGFNLICGNCGEVAFEGNVSKKIVTENKKCELPTPKPSV